ncbi:MAG: glycosyl hydrolase, partial [Bacteroidota bacterium]
MKNRILYILLLATSVLQAQQPTPAAERQAGYEQRLELLDKSTLGNLDFTNIGPTVMSGRVTDLAVNPEDPTEFYVAYASGGLWHTTNNGISFQPLFQEEAVMTIGDVDVHWPTRTIYLGSGEVNSSRSSYAGNGIYKSTDGGKSWTHLGLEETHHIGRVIVDPRSPDTLWVAALGHLYGPNTERGVYKSTNGGKSWTKTLFVNERSGAIDLVQDPRQPNELFAATWERNRSAWDFEESGEGSGLWHSKDGGESWEPFAAEGSGFPLGEGTGRIGIDLYYTEEGKRGFYVALDNYNRRPEEELEDEKLTTRQLKKMSAKEVIDQKDYVLTDFLRENGFPPELTLKKLRKDLVDTILTPTMLVEYLEDANRQLFDTPVIGLEVYRSTDEGKTWERTHEDYLDGVYNSYGYYFG